MDVFQATELHRCAKAVQNGEETTRRALIFSVAFETSRGAAL
jgi:hypothetical protein